jgi:uncharacterized protein (DUF952 family)
MSEPGSELIYHLTTRQAWTAALQAGAYRADSLAEQGFIHCSLSNQVERVANDLYRGRTDLVLLEIDRARLQVEVRWEPGADHPEELFPHLYGALDPGAVIRILPLSPDAEGAFSIPLL